MYKAIPKLTRIQCSQYSLVILAFFAIIFCGTSNAQPITDIVEIRVTAPVPGPPLMRVKKGENTLWIFADVNPVPSDLSWDSSRVERILAEADEYLEAPRTRYNALSAFFSMSKIRKLNRAREETQGDKKLPELIDEVVLQRLRNVTVPDYLDHLSGYKPWFAAEKLKANVWKRAGLSSSESIIKRIENLRRRYRVPVTKTELKLGNEEILAYLEEQQNLPDGYGEACLESTLSMIEGLEELRQNVGDWYRGEANLRVFDDWEEVCDRVEWENSDWYRERGDILFEIWTENISRALNNNRSTFAIMPTDVLIRRRGSNIVEWFAANGYEVIME